MSTVAAEYDVTSICSHGGRVVREVRACLHINAVPVESVVDGLAVARLCLDCDAQLDA